MTESTLDLRRVLDAAFAGRLSAALVQTALDDHAGALAAPLKDSQPDPGQRQRLQEGRGVPVGPVQRQLTPEFAAEALRVASYLAIAECVRSVLGAAGLRHSLFFCGYLLRL